MTKNASDLFIVDNSDRKSSSYGTFHVTHIHFLDKIDSILTIKDQLEKHLPLIGKLDDRNKNNFL
jgi:hypothetical protein